MATPRKLTPIGYSWLARHFNEDPIPHYVESFIAEPGVRISEDADGRKREIYPHTSHRLESIFDHLDFALKREGLHLQLLRAILPKLPIEAVTNYVRATPTGANARRVWYLFEQFALKRLDIPDLRTGNYVNLADTELYFTGDSRLMKRWRVTQNLLHTLDFSPMLRRTPGVSSQRDKDLQAQCQALISAVPPEVYQRALRYLYAIETRTSYAIEHETPTHQRAEKFMALLARAGSVTFLTQQGLVELQNAIVDPRFAESSWRSVQNYVGQTLAPGVEQVHLVPPRPEDIGFLMQQWLGLESEFRFFTSPPPIATAAILAWTFVYLHPFEDGNGRIHRFLIHDVLASQGFCPKGVLLPISAVLLNRPTEYDASLEVFSIPLKARSDFDLDEHGKMTVSNATIDHFRYIDCTTMAEALYRFVEETITTQLPAELRYLQHYDAARAAMRNVVDMPEPMANLFLRLCLQNNGRLSKAKRKHPSFAKLTEGEMAELEAAIAQAYSISASPRDADTDVSNDQRENFDALFD